MLYLAKLARDLESNLPTLANQPQISATKTCKEIIRIFTSALEKLMMDMNCKESTEGHQSCFPRLLLDNNWGSGRQLGSDHQVRAKLLLKAEMGWGSCDIESSATFRGLGGGMLSMEVSSDLNRSASSSQRSRRRREPNCSLELRWVEEVATVKALQRLEALEVDYCPWRFREISTDQLHPRKELRKSPHETERLTS